MLWLGDGNAVGKLHFDPFDNILLQISGSKTFILSDPENNTNFYEGHMREAQLEVVTDVEGDVLSEDHMYAFQKHKLLESTSMVHSPIDIINPNLKRYPNAQAIKHMNCTVNSGEALFVPSYWWHEVVSHPSDDYDSISKLRLNMAINFWYEPLFTKSFPCPTCSKKLNQKYSRVLRDLIDMKNQL